MQYDTQVIEPEEILSLYWQQEGKYRYSQYNVVLRFGKGKHYTLSSDKRNHKEGCTKENMVLVCRFINYCKGTMSQKFHQGSQEWTM